MHEHTLSEAPDMLQFVYGTSDTVMLLRHAGAVGKQGKHEQKHLEMLMLQLVQQLLEKHVACMALNRFC